MSNNCTILNWFIHVHCILHTACTAYMYARMICQIAAYVQQYGQANTMLFFIPLYIYSFNSLASNILKVQSKIQSINVCQSTTPRHSSNGVVIGTTKLQWTTCTHARTDTCTDARTHGCTHEHMHGRMHECTHGRMHGRTDGHRHMQYEITRAGKDEFF